MGTITSNFKTDIIFPGRGSLGDRGAVVVTIVSTKEEERDFLGVSYDWNHHYICHLYYHDGWCFDKIRLMLHCIQVQYNHAVNEETYVERG